MPVASRKELKEAIAGVLDVPPESLQIVVLIAQDAAGVHILHTVCHDECLMSGLKELAETGYLKMDEGNPN